MAKVYLLTLVYFVYPGNHMTSHDIFIGWYLKILIGYKTIPCLLERYFQLWCNLNNKGQIFLASIILENILFADKRRFQRSCCFQSNLPKSGHCFEKCTERKFPYHDCYIETDHAVCIEWLGWNLCNYNTYYILAMILYLNWSISHKIRFKTKIFLFISSL